MNILLNLITKLSKKFDPVSELGFFHQNDSYSEQIYHEFGLNQVQIKKCSLLFTIFFCVVLIVIVQIFAITPLYTNIFLIIIILGYFELNSIFKAQIKKKEFEFGPLYQLLILEIKLGYSTIDIAQDPHVYLLDILSYYSKCCINFAQIKTALFSGNNLVNTLNKMVFYSPNFQNYIRNLIETNYESDLIEFWRNYEDQYKKDFQTFTKSLEMRLNIMLFFSIFYPIFLNLFLITQRVDFQTFFFMLIMQFMILKLILDKTLKNPVNIIGAFNYLDSKEKQIFQEFLRFFHLLTYYSIKNSPESAIFLSIQNLSLKSKKILRIHDLRLNLTLISLKKFLDNLAERFNSTQTKLFIDFFKQIFEQNSAESSTFFAKINKMLNEHYESTNQQETILQILNFKIRLYKILLSFILGFLTPLISNIYQFSFFFSMKLDSIGPISSIQESSYLIGLLSCCSLIISLMFLNKVNNGRRIIAQDSIILLIFIVCYMISKNILMISLF